jgi:hypothetical protein
MATLEIGSIVIPAESLGDWQQSYTDLRAEDFRRTADGSASVRVGWSGETKLQTEVTGDGWVPSGFSALRGSTHTVKCAMVREAESATTAVTLPAARRSDAGHAPIGFALVSGVLVQTAITDITSNVATLTAVSGASGYRVHYYPQITAYITNATTRGGSNARFAWRLEAQEV